MEDTKYYGNSYILTQRCIYTILPTKASWRFEIWAEKWKYGPCGILSGEDWCEP